MDYNDDDEGLRIGSSSTILQQRNVRNSFADKSFDSQHFRFCRVFDVKVGEVYLEKLSRVVHRQRTLNVLD